MQFKSILVTLSAVVAFVTAQDLSGLPECSRPCFYSAFPSSGCDSPANSPCVCSSAVFGEQIKDCTLRSCSPTDQLATFQWSIATCAAAGVPLAVGGPPGVPAHEAGDAGKI
ncbi:hypothetical protein GE09DRAFT_468394 [Coniochaeta sp. 2T2.1]|nr:hypothetical protein GE09DRAFT_468394 [Coniochaeta sp. 2T2.1]